MKSINTVVVAAMLTHTLNPVASVLASETEQRQEIVGGEEITEIDNNLTLNDRGEILENEIVTDEEVQDSLEKEEVVEDFQKDVDLDLVPSIEEEVTQEEPSMPKSVTGNDTPTVEEKTHSKAQFVEFEDEVFKKIVLANHDTDKDGEISLEEAQNITSLSSEGNYEFFIHSLKGIEQFTNLRDLTLNGYDIKDISYLSQLVQLNNLDLSKNRIDDINAIENITNLTNLNLGFNIISNISPLENLKNLISLNIDANMVTDISVIGALSNLSRLSIKMNQITDLSPLSQLSQLDELDSGMNPNIEDLQVISSLVNLKKLSLNSMKIEDLNFLTPLVNLQYLDIGVNNIKDLLPISQLNNLNYVNTYNNPLNDLTTNNAAHLSGFDFLGKEVWIELSNYVEINKIEGGKRVVFNEQLNVESVTINGEVVQVSDHEIIISENISEFEIFINYRGHNGRLYSFTLQSLSNLEGNISFKDENLKRKITSFTKNVVDTNQDGEISYQEARVVKELDLTNQTPWADGERITFSNLSGLEYFSNLEKIRFDTGGFEDLSPLASLLNLKEFTAWTGSISDIRPLAKIPNLETISLHCQFVKDLSVMRDMTNLKDIDLQVVPYLRDISSVAKLIKDSNHHIRFYENENSLYNSTILGAVKLENLTITDRDGKDVEVWIVVDDYVSYSMDDNQVTLTFKPGLDIKEIEVNGEKQTLENNVLVLPNTDAYNQMTIYDTYGHTIPYNISHLKQNIEFGSSSMKLRMIELGIDLDGDGEISYFEAQRVESLDLTHLGASDLTGLEHFTNLTSVDLSYNIIRDVESLKGLKKLESVKLLHNSLSDLTQVKGLSELNQVKSLDLSYNSIQAITPLTNLSSVHTLNLSFNQITDLNGISILPGLSSLYATDNQIKSIADLASCLELWEVDLSNNQIEDILSISYKLKQNEYFRYTIDNNPIYTNPFERVIHLSGFDFDGNKVVVDIDNYITSQVKENQAQLNFSPLLQVTSIFVEGKQQTVENNQVLIDSSQTEIVVNYQGHNQNSYQFIYQLTTPENPGIPETSSKIIKFENENLKKKILSFRSDKVDLNNDGEISVAEAGKVKTLNLSNSYGSISDYIQIENLKGLEYFVNLEVLDLSSQFIKDLGPIKDLTSLKELHAVYTHIEDFTPIQGLTNLEKLTVVSAPIKDLSPLRSLTSLNYLVLQGIYDTKDISSIAKLIKDSNHEIILNSYNNSFYNKQTPNAVKLEKLTIPKNSYNEDDIEVWIVVDDYVSYKINDKELTLTFDKGLDVKTIKINDKNYTLENNVLVIPNNDSYNQMTIYDTYGHAITYSVEHLKKVVNFSDTKLKEALIAIGVDANKDGEITEFEALQVTNLDLANKGITNLEGLEYFKNVTYLDLSKNKIDDISALNALKLLDQVNLAQNNITDLSPLDSLQFLYQLDISSNRVSSLAPLVNCSQLYYLYASHNEIRDLLVISQKLKDNDGWFTYEIEENPLYDGSEDGTVHLENLDFENQEVWINPSEYVSYIVKDDIVSVSFNHILKISDVELNDQELKLQDNVVSFSKNDKQMTLSIIDQYENSYVVVIDFVYEDNNISFEKIDSNILVVLEGTNYSISNVSEEINEIIFKPRTTVARVRGIQNKSVNQFVIDVHLENGATSFVVNGKSLVDYTDGIRFEFKDVMEQYEVVTVDDNGKEVSKFNVEIQNINYDSDKPTGDKPTGDKPTGDKPTGDKPTGDKPTGDKPTGDKPTGDKPTEPEESNNSGTTNGSNAQGSPSNSNTKPSTGLSKSGLMIILGSVFTTLAGGFTFFNRKNKK